MSRQGNPRTPEIEILEPSARGQQWSTSTIPFGPATAAGLAGLPDQCYAFLLDRKHYPPADGRRETLLAHFNVPEFLADRACFELNGYFGCKPTYDDHDTLTSCTTWFRILTKMVRKVKDDPNEDGHDYVDRESKKDYKWFETTVFTRWESPGHRCQVLVVDCPFDLPAKLRTALEKRQSGLDFRDPFGMHPDLMDQLIVHMDVSVWRIRDPVRQLEKSRLRAGAIFAPMHEISRHAIHASEILEVAIDTITEIQRCQTDIHEETRVLGKTYKKQAKEYSQFQIQLVKALKRRSDSSQKRLENEVHLAFNNIARQDNSVMKSIALLGMIFLPATFISAIFSTTFFNFGQDGEWDVSGKLWVYWAVTIPLTILVVVVWRVWLACSDRIMKSLERLWVVVKGWAKNPRGQKKQAKHAAP
ncbi:hypothetical protein QBC46DRAFT_381473 [Diplogelasinospora grovesii]|uniref:Uncharacterized protein n=1 Tax=Diplogelasinospora grovesii TaxID=303347 RepID=A0AAN6N9Q5_9PEZI|nr:hypothetical protein QBC46DRAFT_381473 [Diplogelasinospora grovesii]